MKMRVWVRTERALRRLRWAGQAAAEAAEARNRAPAVAAAARHGEGRG